VNYSLSCAKDRQVKIIHCLLLPYVHLVQRVRRFMPYLLRVYSFGVFRNSAIIRFAWRLSRYIRVHYVILFVHINVPVIANAVTRKQNVQNVTFYDLLHVSHKCTPITHC